MADLCEGGNEPPGSLKPYCNRVSSVALGVWMWSSTLILSTRCESLPASIMVWFIGTRTPLPSPLILLSRPSRLRSGTAGISVSLSRSEWPAVFSYHAYVLWRLERNIVLIVTVLQRVVDPYGHASRRAICVLSLYSAAEVCTK
ncbi:hypothetical protein ANN_14857 [Periplaneta americana]|uniref:Uncharacterized protein n=1 Tax=Periplaneta americana TaxID=6978 RepID=A0ABQ8SYQ6_PERAM|nr:hypothetical protein ANN_14857 [Periplaneta americana]